MKLIWFYLKKHKKLLFLTLLLAAVNQFFSLLDPQIFRLLIDNYALKIGELSKGDFLQGIIFLLLGLIGVAMISRLAKTFQNYFLNVTTERMGTALYAHAVKHTFSLPYAVFEDQRSGEVLLKLERARDDAKKLVSQAVSVLFISLVGMTIVLVYAFMVHWSIGIAFSAMLPILASFVYVLSKKIKKAQTRIVKTQAELAGSTTETLRNVELVKSLGLDNQEITRLNNVNEQVLDLELEKVKIIHRLIFLQGTIVNFFRVVLMFLMLWLIYLNIISLGQFFTLLFYSFFIFGPLQEFGQLATQYRETEASSRELSKILDKPVEEKKDSLTALSKLEKIEFKNVTLTYSSQNKPSLHNINLTIKPGQTIALVGPSGSGKSTLVKLLVGLYQPTKGKLSFNEIDSKKINFDGLRQRIGLVTQETHLFAGSIRENLFFVKPNATDKECLEVIKDAQAQEILTRGGKGLNTKIGEGGIKLSGGERQRLAIARALLRKPEFFIFDEATSSLDSITEQAITKTIQKIELKNPNLIRVLIAHRLSTIVHAQIIYVLQKGQIVEQGSHQSLLVKKGLYYALWQEQNIFN